MKKNGVLPLILFSTIMLMSFIFLKQDQKITLEEFRQKVGQSEKITLVYFSARWCLICPKMKPAIDEIENEKNPKLQVLRIDTDRDREIAEEFEISSLPVLMIYKNGNRQWLHVGLIDKSQLKEKINTY